MPYTQGRGINIGNGRWIGVAESNEEASVAFERFIDGEAVGFLIQCSASILLIVDEPHTIAKGIVLDAKANGVGTSLRHLQAKTEEPIVQRSLIDSVSHTVTKGIELVDGLTTVIEYRSITAYVVMQRGLRVDDKTGRNRHGFLFRVFWLKCQVEDRALTILICSA